MHTEPPCHSTISSATQRWRKRQVLSRPRRWMTPGGGWLTDSAHIYIESPSSQSIAIPENWQLLKEKIAGQVAYRLYQRQADNNQ